MAKLIVKDGKIQTLGGQLITDAGGAPCCCDGGTGGDTCPAPCVVVVITDLQYVMGDTSHPCFINGGPVGQGIAGFTGAFLLNLDGPNGGYSGTFPVSYSFIQSAGTELFDTFIGGEMSIVATVGECVNGVIDGFFAVSQSAIGFSIDELGNIDFGVAGPGGFSGGSPDGQPIPLGQTITDDSGLDNFGCTSLGGIIYGGRATVIQPPACTLPPIYYLAELCGDPSQTISIDLFTIPTQGAASCRYQGNLYRPTITPTGDDPVDVVWGNELCDQPTASNPVARDCGGSGSTITFDPDDRPPNGVTIRVGPTIYVPTQELSDEPPTPGEWLNDPCPIDVGPCHNITGPDDPRCDEPETFNCPQCYDGSDVGRPTDPPGLELPESDPPGFGDFVKRAIEITRLDRMAPSDCSSCERRRIILNEFGDRVGRAVIRRLKI